MPCPKCHDTKHVLVDGKYRRCGCMRESYTASQYRLAGVPDLFLSPSADPRERSAWPVHVPYPPPLGKRSLAWIRGPRVSIRRLATIADILRRAVDAGQYARTLTIPEAVEARFDRDRAATLRETLRADFLVVDLDHDPPNRMTVAACSDIVTQRLSRRAATVFVSEDDVEQATAKFGVPLSSVVRASKAIVRVVVEARRAKKM